ncbi:MAG: GntR family transcriptional regulator, partial [Cryptosporangiaceae bacterium]|nr:GntR family transcriptional regulator [Cryptosporangiaceae bacterium]
MTAEPDFTPRYYRIEQALRALIAAARPNDPLPSEAELSRQYSVSRMTARAAVTRVVGDGLAYREAGRGTFVAVPATRRQADNLLRFSDEMRRQGRRPSSRLLTSGTRLATMEESARLRLGAHARVVAIDRVRLADSEPIAIECAVFPAALAALLNADLENGSLHEAVIALGRTPASGSASLAARNADRADARLLGLATGAALLVEHRLILDDLGEPLELTESRYAGERYSLDVAFAVRSDPQPEPPLGAA